MNRSRSIRVLVAAVVAACLVLAPLPASAGTVVANKRPLVKLSAEQLRSKGVQTLRTLELPPDEIAGTISGHVGHEGGMYEDSSMWAVLFMGSSADGWFAVNGSPVSVDGTYSVEVPEAGDYRVGIWDGAYVYGETYYDGASTVESGTSIPVSIGATVAGIDVTVTPLPENIISGTVSFVGAKPPSGDVEKGDFVEVDALQYDTDLEDYMFQSYGKVKADGTYRLHLPKPGAYRLDFYDNTGVFQEVYYKDAESADEATEVVVPSPAESKSGIDQTMTVIPTRRISGDDRYETAAAVSQYGFPDGGAGTVYLATGEKWPDAISGSVLAARNGSPLLLSKQAYLPEVTADEILRLDPYEVVIVGGYDSVSLDVEIALRTEFGIPFVWRLAGRDRYETAVLVAEQMMPRDGEGIASRVPASFPATPPVVLASGERFPDAMSAAPLAANAGSPVLLVKHDAVPASVQAFLERHDGDFDQTLVIGGPSAIASATADEFPDWQRLAGADRYATAAEVADYGVQHFEMDPSCVGVASGMSFPDGLAAVPLLAMRWQPLLFTSPAYLSEPTEQFMVDHGTSRALVFGGEPSVSPDAYQRILEVLGN